MTFSKANIQVLHQSIHQNIRLAKGCGGMSINYLLHESSVGYAIFEVVYQPDTIGNKLKEVQDAVQVGNPSLCLLLIFTKNNRTSASLERWSN